MYPGDNFPAFVSGGGYLFPAWATSCLFLKGLDTPYLSLEDVFITGIVREKCGLQAGLLLPGPFSPEL